MNNIAFFYPSRTIGGAQLLFARLAEYLIDNNKPVLIIDYSDGFLVTYLKDNKNTFTHVIYNDEQVELSENVCLVQHLSSVHTINSKVKLTIDSTFVFWSIHPHNVLSLMRLTPLYTRAPFEFSNFISSLFENRRKSKVKALLKQMSEHSALYYMDKANVTPSQNMQLFNKSVDYLPIPILEKEGLKTKKTFEEIHVAWIGRITDEKIIPFNYVIDQLDKCQIAFKITFHVIGYGDLEYLSKVKNIKIVNHGIVSSAELDSLLLSQIDCVFAMGTSVLESAALGIPSILVDLSKKRFPKNYKFMWIFETKDYTLGGEAKYFTGHLSINELMDQISNSFKYSQVGSKCRDYAIIKHGIDEIGTKLLNATNQSSFTFEYLKDFYPN